MEELILQICREVNPDVPDDGDVKLFDEGFIDSFGAYMILAYLELEFDIHINESEMNYEHFKDIDSIKRLVELKLERRNGQE